MFLVLSLIYAFVGFNEMSLKTNHRKLLCFVCLFPAFFLTAFRDVSVGNDTITYFRAFDYVAHFENVLDAIKFSRMEAGYVLLNYVFSHANQSYYCMQFWISLFVYAALFFFLCRYSKNISLSCFVFLTLRFMLGPMVVVRMWIALSILLFALFLLEKNKKLLFSICVIIASQFHLSALIFFPLLFLLNVKLNKKSIFTLIILSFIILGLGKTFFSYLTQFFYSYQGYLDGKYFDVQDNIAIYIQFFIDLVLSLFVWLANNAVTYKVNRPDEKMLSFDSPHHLSMDFICNWSIVLILCLDIIGLNNAIMNRLSGYFMFAWLYLLPKAFLKISNKYGAFLLFLIVIFFFILQFQIVMVYRPNWNGVEPYSFYFE
ncbi:EpsG family protein [Candidatus Saccharibacteria bacterium]|nr:EpsG family protein [Candidatus Saccharibacteria bacterium]